MDSKSISAICNDSRTNNDNSKRLDEIKCYVCPYKQSIILVSNDTLEQLERLREYCYSNALDNQSWARDVDALTVAINIIRKGKE